MDNSTKVLLAAVAGAAAGSIIGLLLAPNNGKETREQILTAANELNRNLEELATKSRGSLGEMATKGRHSLEELAEKGRHSLEELTTKGRNALEDYSK